MFFVCGHLMFLVLSALKQERLGLAGANDRGSARKRPHTSLVEERIQPTVPVL